MHTTSTLGLAAEYLVCMALCEKGFKAYLAPAGARYDVVVDYKGKLLKIQVKGTTSPKPKSKAHKNMTYHFSLKNSNQGKRIDPLEIDIVALVAMDIKIIAYLSPTKCLTVTIDLQRPGVSIGNKGSIDQFPFEKLIQEAGL